jgi:hypothetical protein
VFADDLGYGGNYPDNALIPCDIAPHATHSGTCRLKWGNSSLDTPAKIIAYPGATITADDQLAVTFMVTNPASHTNNNIIVDVGVETWDDYNGTPAMADSAFLHNIFTVVDAQGANNYVATTTLNWNGTPTALSAAIA